MEDSWNIDPEGVARAHGRPSQIAVLRALRILNEDNRITIFSLIGRSDLMADVTT